MGGIIAMTATAQQVLQQLIDMSHELGQPEYELAMLGEGNTSALLDDGSFFVKASGCTLANITESRIARLLRAPAEALLDCDLPTDDAILTGLMSVAADDSGNRPSIESMMHAYLLGIPDIRFVGHTHPISVNGLLCSTRAEELVNTCLFPDQVVCCGFAPVFVPFMNPGLELARMVRERVNAWMDTYGIAPRAVMLQNHGMFAIGATAQQVVSCMRMWSKTARVMIGALSCGGINPLTPEQVQRIFTSPDEKFRAQIIGGLGSQA